MKYPEADKIADILKNTNDVVVVQADNPDGDSLASSLALEQILGDLGKEPHLYCSIDMPGYLHHLPGWDRVGKELPKKFDAVIIVDTSAGSLLENSGPGGELKVLAGKPTIVLDHHPVEASIPFASVVCNHPAVATGEIIYELAQQLGWKLSPAARDMLAVSIMSDSLGLTTEGTTARSIQIISELVEQGVSLPKLEAARRELMRKSPELLKYKGRLLQRIEYFDNQRIAVITIPWEEIEKYSPLYNPPMLVIDDMRLSEGTELAIAFKAYPDGKVTGKLRANHGKGVAGKVAEAMGGGGHAYASGFKITDGRSLADIKAETIKIASEALDEIDHEIT